jgi:hypothetical protein
MSAHGQDTSNSREPINLFGKFFGYIALVFLGFSILLNIPNRLKRLPRPSVALDAARTVRQ